ncbi:hypothetical protein A3C98_03745 [Candidatus Roizmanbacteria bacterium RIFCSPHIGHO2_02_FULL_37_15]|uniref:GIY-YIG domain-containing protein n=1 Tax=Candidatus Roizmanbacteria bacterium RIFCSPLOWO2_01_FULL_37_16 TaxID=1802058 RepID=A0A1F7IKL9_9BACT|nr:MAG: hypothetical protein A2859_04985 [Candidatus Roizmanbacteria bacterium RIFCSPHIGHO2_01_FULL_37_16b]OGK20481.1 MAG: hypothetical protein A3C98_03745 [Candidatus Roizmanbacteria bacterium RIFCSPHIGHO2_02_FULL_37_15]OGK31748.1 MAG: hypothetical protein A3F57_00155 [Candidatus Roizmanbacteria bacterium RIFCSPHIGHO2_12_FULL_36_11]OGK43908.1 MAG: hypothetical protein A3B40_03790 [Candidatus Roizmanbacteria bacterium RIFCSPLOWO2_01_FULL_37_16]OGK55833.1 MAG: hypothetical protein A3I50_03395 [C
MNYVYVLKSSTRIYIGRTSKLKERINEHFKRKTWTTRRFKKLELIFYEAFKDKIDSIRRERYFKTSKGKSSLKQIIRESLK